FLRNGALDAHTSNDTGSKFRVQNNFGRSLSCPIIHNETFFFVNYEGLRLSKSDTMIDTVPTEMEAMGDFSMSGRTIYNPVSAHANPNFDSTKPISPANPQIIRDPFPGNLIPSNLINPAAASFLQKYVPRPNMEIGLNGCGGTMMGQPTVVESGVDCNNYTDTQDQHHATEPGTIRTVHQ